MTWTDIAWTLVYALLLLGAGSLVGSWLTGVAASALDRARVDPAVRHLLVGAVRPVVMGFAALAALAALGISDAPLAAVAGAVALAAGLGLWGVFASGAAGALILGLRPYAVDDRVALAGTEGTVRAIGMFGTVVETDDGARVLLPHDLVWRAPIVAHTAPDARVELVWDVPIDADLDRASAEVAEAVAEQALAISPPALLWGAASDRSIQLSARVVFPRSEAERARSDLQRAVLTRWAVAGVRSSPAPTRAPRKS